MYKNWWVLSTFLCGIILCVFKGSAFAVLGVVVGLLGIAGGVWFLHAHSRRYSLFWGISVGVGLIIIGLTLVILCIFLRPVAYFLGGIILAAAGIFVLILCGRRDRFLFCLAIGCIVAGGLILFLPTAVIWMTVAVGVAMIIYSGISLVYMF